MHLFKRAKSDDCDVGWHAARILRWTKDARAVDPLVCALRDSECKVRCSARKSLVVAGEQRVRPLIAARREADRDVRWRTALGRLKDAAAVDSLVLALKDADPYERLLSRRFGLLVARVC